MLFGLIFGKSKHFGECIEFIALVVFVKSKINYMPWLLCLRWRHWELWLQNRSLPTVSSGGVPAKLQKMRFTPEQIEKYERKLNK